MVSFNHDVSSLTRKDPALKYNLRNRPSSRSAVPVGPAPRAQRSSRGRGEGQRGSGQKPSRGPALPGETPWGLPALSSRGRAQSREGERPRSNPRRDTAVTPLASSCRPPFLSFKAHQAEPLTVSFRSHGGRKLRGSCGRVGGDAPGPGRGDGCWPDRDAQAPREGVNSVRAAARKPPDFPEMSISGEI